MAAEKYSPRERLEMILGGERPDRYAASFWQHFFHRESSAEGTAEAMVWFQKQCRWDFMKINPRADYHIEDWGLTQRYSTGEFEKHHKLTYPVNRLEDWLKIRPLPLTAPALAEHLKLVSLIRKQVGRDLPLLMTVFTPLAIAGRMVKESAQLVEHLQTDPLIVEAALHAITDTFSRFVVELRNAGADGIFYATTHWASEDLLSWDMYEQFGVPFDLNVIQALDADSLNLLHVCESNNYLSRLAKLDYRSRLVNWDSANPTNLPLDKGMALLPERVLVGGVDQTGWLVRSVPSEMSHLIGELKKKHDPRRLIIGPGCAIPPETDLNNLLAIRESL